MLVIDASCAIRFFDSGADWGIVGDADLVAPPLLWSEVTSSVHAAAWRGARSREEASLIVHELLNGPIRRRNHRRLQHEAWRIADELGWAKTYDAEYVALAALLGCRLLTLDGRLRRGADRLGYVITPGEL